MYCITSNVEYELLIYIVTVYLKPLAEAGDFFLLQKLPGRLWGAFRPLFNRYCGSFPEVSGRSVNVATYLRLVSRLGMSGSIFLKPHIPSRGGLRQL